MTDEKKANIEHLTGGVLASQKLLDDIFDLCGEGRPVNYGALTGVVGQARLFYLNAVKTNVITEGQQGGFDEVLRKYEKRLQA